MTLPLVLEENYLETAIAVQVLTSQALFTFEHCYSNSTLHTRVCSYRKTSKNKLLSTMDHLTHKPRSKPTHHLASLQAHPPPSLIPSTPTTWPHSQSTHHLASFPVHPPPGLIPSTPTTRPHSQSTHHHAPSTTNAESQRIRLTFTQ